MKLLSLYVCNCCENSNIMDRSGGAVGKNIRFACGRLVVRIPAATDKVKTGNNSLTAKRSPRIIGEDHYKRMPRVTIGVAR